MSVPSAPTISVNATTSEPLFFSRNMGHMIHIAFETIILSIMSYYFYRKTSTLSNELKVMEAKISQLELTVKEQKTFINEKIAEMVSLVSTQISRSSFQSPPPPPRQVYQNFQQPAQYQQQVQPPPQQFVQSQPVQQFVQPPPQQFVQSHQPVQSQPQSQQPVQSQPQLQQQVQPQPQLQQQPQSQQQSQPQQPVQSQIVQSQPAQSQQSVQQQHRYSDNMADVSIVLMEVMSNPTPKNEKYSQISVIEDDNSDDDDETIDMDKELKEELSELSSS